jgi:protein-disulfide isomerase
MSPRRSLLLVGVFGVVLAASACGGSTPSLSPSSTTATTATTAVTLPSVQDMMADRALGSSTAPVTMVEYSSLTCPHCASFHQSTLPQVTSTYVETGKVRFIYRDFPLDGAALSASMVARCSGDQSFAVVARLMETQPSWTASSNLPASFQTVLASLNISRALIDTCLANAELRSGILAMENAGRAAGVSGTPTVFINDQRVEGSYPFATYDAVIRQQLGQ